MTDPDLIEKRLAWIERLLAELRSMVRPEAIPGDLMVRRFTEHTLQLAIQAALDVASHIVSDQHLGEPRTNRELFELLANGGWLEPDQVPALRSMTGFRNIVVHGYLIVDPAIVRNVVENHLTDLDRFVLTIRRMLGPALP